MTVVLVHGNPETDVVWEPLAAALAREGHAPPVRLSPPGFGASVPAGFDVSPEGYRAWLAGELERIGTPVDLVGHDWGAAHVVNVAMTRPDLIRSWATNAIGPFHPEYVWHELARVWQTPGAGEAWVERQLAGDELVELFRSRGTDEATARAVAAGFDATMGECILRLYRAAAQPVMAGLGARLPDAAGRPGLVCLAKKDIAVGTVAQRHEAAAWAEAEVFELPGAGHWWLTAPDQTDAARALTRLWARARLLPTG